MGAMGASSRKMDNDLRIMDEAQNPNDYIMPDGSKITLSQHDKSKAPEIMFRPSLIGLEYPGIHEIVQQCIKACDVDLRSHLSSQIIVAGATTQMSGFCARLHKHIKFMMPQSQSVNTTKVTLMAPANRHISSWAGGSAICELTTFDKMWISKKQFDSEDGRILSVNCM